MKKIFNKLDIMKLIKWAFFLILAIFIYRKFGEKIVNFFNFKQWKSTNKFGDTGEGGINADEGSGYESSNIMKTLAGGVDHSKQYNRVEKDQPLINLAVYIYTKLNGVTWTNQHTAKVNRVANLSVLDTKFLLGVFWSKYNKDLKGFLEDEKTWDIAYIGNIRNPFNPAIERIIQVRKILAKK